MCKNYYTIVTDFVYADYYIDYDDEWGVTKVVNLEGIIGMAMRVQENFSGKYMSNINIGKGTGYITQGDRQKLLKFKWEKWPPK